MHPRSANRKDGWAGGRAPLWTAILALTVVLRLPALVHPRAIDDEATYAVVAGEMVEGGLPYVSAIERKPPLLFVVYAAVLELSGKYNWFALHATALAWVALTMVALSGAGRVLFSERAGLAAALLYSLYQPWATWKNLAFNGEVLMNLPIAAAVLLVVRPARSRVRPELVAAGVLLAAAFLLKQPAAIAAVPLGLYLLLPAYRRQRDLDRGWAVLQAGLLTAGFAVALAGTALVLWKQGILEEAYFWTIAHHDVPHGPADPVFWIRGGRTTLAFVGACAPLLVGAAVALRRRDLWRGREAERAALGGLVLASALGTAASGRFYPHYFIQLVLPLALLAGPVVSAGLWRNGAIAPRSFRGRTLTLWLGVTAAGFTVAHAVGLAGQRHPTDVGRYVRHHARPDDRIFVWGQGTGIYLDAQRRPATRYVATFPLTGYVFGSPLSWDPDYDTSHRIVPGSWERFHEDVRRHPPAFIVDTDAVRNVPRYPLREFPALARLVEENYQPVYRGTEGVVYRLRERGTR